MSATTTTANVLEAAEFIRALFVPGDILSFRPMELWEGTKRGSEVIYDLCHSVNLSPWHWTDEARLPNHIAKLVAACEKFAANVFFGVCPRFGGDQKYEESWQIRTVRALWSDIDDGDPQESIDRCRKVGLPEPSIVVSSGRGTHVYWMLADPYLINDVAKPPEVLKHFSEEEPKISEEEPKKKKPRKYILGQEGEKLFLDRKQNVPELSLRALHIQDVVQGIASVVGGDHTYDLARLLRLPGTLNRKNQRNGKEPVPCSLVTCDPNRRYPIEDFAPFAAKSPKKVKRERVSKVPLPPARRRISGKRQDKLRELITACCAAEVGQRSEADWRLLCFCIEQGIGRDAVWAEVQGIGKFSGDERYFSLTWEKAEHHTREKLFDRAKAKQAKKDTASATPGETDVQGNTAETADVPLCQAWLQPQGRTDIALGRRLVALYGTDLRYCSPWDSWLVWDGRRWKKDDTNQSQYFAKKSADRLWQELADSIKAGLVDVDGIDTFIGWFKSAASSRSIDACLKMARSEPGIPVAPAELDNDQYLLNVENGTIDLRHGTLQPHNRRDMITKLAPVAFIPGSACETWERFLARVQPDDEQRTFIQRFFGYCLTGSTVEHILPIPYGEGANGKSTFINTLLAMLGSDYAMKATSDLMLAKNGQSHPTELTDLFGRRLVVSIETDEGRRLAESLIKEMTGGDSIRARRMREDFWEFNPTHKLVLVTNHKPIVRGNDHAVWRRLRLVPFDQKIPDHEKDKHLPEKLRAELPGILSWAVSGCLEWQREGLNEPASVLRATNGYRDSMDVAKRFVSDCCVIPDDRDGEFFTQASRLYKAYCLWSRNSALRPMSVTKFGSRLTEMGYETKKKDTCNVRLNIILTDDICDAMKQGEETEF